MSPEEAYREFLINQATPPPAPAVQIDDPLLEDTGVPSRDLAGDVLPVLKDLGGGIMETPGAFLRGTSEGIHNIFDAANDAANFMEKKFPLAIPIPKTGIDALDQLLANPAAAIAGPSGVSDQLTDEPESVTGGLVKGITQFMVGFQAKGLKAGARELIKSPIAQSAIKGAGADAFTFDPTEERLSNLILEHTELRLPILSYLASSPDDTKAEGRLKNAIEGLFLGVSADLVIKLIPGLVKGTKFVKAKMDAGEVTPLADAVQRFREGKSPFPVGMSIEDVGPGARAVRADDDVYHVTLERNLEGIEQTGIRPLQPSNFVLPDGSRANEQGGVFFFDNAEDAVRHAKRMEFDFPEERISIIRTRRPGDTELDPTQDITFTSGKGQSLQSLSGIRQQDIVDVTSISDLPSPADLGQNIDEFITSQADNLRGPAAAAANAIPGADPTAGQVNMRIQQTIFENDIRAGRITPETPGVDPDEVRAIQADQAARGTTETVPAEGVNDPIQITAAPVAHTIASEADNANNIINRLYNNTDDIPPPPNGRKWTKADLAADLERTAKEAGRFIDDFEDASAERIADTITDEAVAALARDGNASDWYNAKLTEMNDTLLQLHPELIPDSAEEGMFKLGLAITSNGSAVDYNLRAADHLFEVFKTTGRFPTDLQSLTNAVGGFGQEGPTLVKQMQRANDMIEEMTVEGFVRFLNEPITVRELKAAGFKISGESMDFQTHGSAIFGPKIGGGFYQNLRGNFDPVTFDRWWMASWGRWTGNAVLRATPKAQADQLKRFKEAMAGEGKREFKQKAAAIREADKIFAKYRQNNFQPRTELNKAAQRLSEGNSDKMREQPAGPSARAFMRSTVQKTVAKLQELGHNLTNADLQATVWYPEKELHGRLGIGNGRSAPDDYAAAALRLLESRNAPR